jgi:hypothetical protein
MSKQYEFLVCPFCHKGEISCLYFPSAVSVKRNVTASLPGKGSISKSRETWIVQSGCINCGKGKDEVERELRKEGFA